MKLNTVTTYILVCLLTRGNWNLVLPAKGDGDGNGSANESSAESTEATPANGSADGSTADESSEATPANLSTDATPEGEAGEESIESMLSSQVAKDSALEAELGDSKAEHSESEAKKADPRETAYRLLRPFKDDGNGVAEEMVEKDLFKDYYKGYLTKAFKKDVKCVLVKLGEADVWKTGERELGEPKSVTLNVVLNRFTVRDAKNAAYFKKDATTGEWQYVATFPRRKVFVAEGTKTSGSEGEARESSTVPSTDPTEANGSSQSTDPNGSTDGEQAKESSPSPDANESSESDQAKESSESDQAKESSESDQAKESSEGANGSSQSTDPDQASEDANGSSVPATE